MNTTDRWDRVRIGRLFSPRTALDPSRHPSEEFELFSIPAFDAGAAEVTAGAAIGSTKIVVSPGDTLISKIVPHIQRTWVVPKASGRRQIASSEWIVMKSEHVRPEYLRYALLDRGFHAQFMATVDGLSGSLQRARPQAVRSIEIVAPSVSLQTQVADYLDRETAQIDAFIAKNENLITLLAERRSATIENAVAPAVTPSKWRLTHVRRLGPRNQSGVSVNGYSIPASDEEIGVLKTGAVSKGRFDARENKRVVEEDLARVATPVRGGTLIVNRANTPELVGRAAYVPDDHPTLFLSDKLWQLTFTAADTAFMHYWTLSESYRSQIRQFSVGASSSMQNLSYGHFLSMSITLPPLPHQQRIVEQLDHATKWIEAASESARRAIALARERRAALISAAVTGKIDVGGAA